MADRKRVSTAVVKCRECEFDDRERYVIHIVYENGDVEVRCNGGCSACKYRRPVLRRKESTGKGGEGNERGKGDKRRIKEAKGRALEKDATSKQLLSPCAGNYDWCFGMGFG